MPLIVYAAFTVLPIGALAVVAYIWYRSSRKQEFDASKDLFL